jgi:hypothetical protein
VQRVGQKPPVLDIGRLIQAEDLADLIAFGRRGILAGHGNDRVSHIAKNDEAHKRDRQKHDDSLDEAACQVREHGPGS